MRPIEAAHLDLVRRVVADVLDVTPEVSQGQVTAPVRDPAAVPAIVRRLDDLDVVAAELSLRRASLDEVFLALTGHRAEAQDQADEEQDAEAAA